MKVFLLSVNKLHRTIKAIHVNAQIKKTTGLQSDWTIDLAVHSFSGLVRL